MRTRRILSVVGGWPQGVKAAVVGRVRRVIRGVYETTVHTGQPADPKVSDPFPEALNRVLAEHPGGVVFTSTTLACDRERGSGGR